LSKGSAKKGRNEGSAQDNFIGLETKEGKGGGKGFIGGGEGGGVEDRFRIKGGTAHTGFCSEREFLKRSPLLAVEKKEKKGIGNLRNKA